MSYIDKTNKEIFTEIKQMEMDHQNLKVKLIALLDQLDELEKKYNIANNELKKRGVK
jgi:septal ring factor EnvC (AmiA/AmiB activator)